MRMLYGACVLIISTFSLAYPVHANEPGKKFSPSLFGVSEWKFTSSQICRNCHPDHYDMWSHSMHALSVDDPIFKVSFLQAQVIGGDKIRENCLTCHAPIATSNRDYSLSNESTREGVTCDFCHSVTDVHIGRSPNPYDVKPGATKYGPTEAIQTPAHKSKQLDIFKSAAFCGGCHELVNDYGVTVMGTYSEWREGPYPDENVQCQNCHMPLTMKATAVTLEGDTLKNLAHDHQFQGGHSQINLKNAASMEFHTTIRDQTAQIVLYITNKESGHKLPTGMPGRKVILKVRVYDNNNRLLAQPMKIYRKALIDKDGAILEDNANQLLNAVKVFNDNRIAPKERRREEFIIDLPQGVTDVKVMAELLYEYETPVMYTQKIQTEMANVVANYVVQKTDVVTTESSAEYIWLYVIFLAFALMGVTYWLLSSKDKKKVKVNSIS